MSLYMELDKDDINGSQQLKNIHHYSAVNLSMVYV